MTGRDTFLDLPRALPPVLGLGAFLKASLCHIDGTRARVTPDAGDLGTLEAVQRYDTLLAGLLDGATPPVMAAHDLHPDFHSTRTAATLDCVPLGVQHHHAHTLATQWEHGQHGAVLGLSLDGFGLGPGGESWGGELLEVDGPVFTRIGHLAMLPQPGGDVAAREPWRMAAAALWRLGRGDEIATRFADQPHAALLAQMLDRRVNAPETSSCGRLFDAACGLLGVHPVATFEGQAPMALEAMANAPDTMEGGWTLVDGRLDFAPLLDRVSDLTPERGANLFHGTLAAGFADQVREARKTTGLSTIAVGGGCFLNRVFTEALTTRLEADGIEVLRPMKLSPGDAGLSFGQAIAAALTAERQMQGDAPCA
ncbi:Kae1-like domain-containing protein [Marimonas arenosa]|uniref:Carbamoyltransferase HypF n=1 Tax=Marimonas arenosa TaxID=1795305 RepID=A0AAE4B406_9RHOB|nr:carbamoyltransferase HypF [Marimonas arenosa]MDQ2089735.1 carbamoyltransferase HypF [Marimonas arenosa]